jgi:hypothetical protein
VNFNTNTKFPEGYPDGFFSSLLCLEDNVVVCGYQEFARFSVYKWDGKKMYFEQMR